MAKPTTKTVRHRTENTVTDATTGEILSHESSTTYKVASESDYVKMYVEPMAELKLKPHLLALIYQMSRKLDYDNVVALTPGMRARFCEELKIQSQTFRNYLNDLLERDVFRRIGQGEFMANPKFMSKSKPQELDKRQEQYYSIRRVKTQKGRLPGQTKGQERFEFS